MGELRMTSKGFRIVLSALALAGCGGGGSSPAPIATGPAPAPAPSPTATPSPSPTYGLATDFSADRDYPGWGVRIVSTYTAPPFGSPAGTSGTTRSSAQVADETRAAGFTYVARTRTYTARWFDDIRSFGPAISGVFDDYLPFDQVGDFAFYRSAIPVAPTVRDYTRHVGAFRWQISTGNGNFALDSELREHFSVFGLATQASDLPTAGSTTYQMVVNSRLVNIGTAYVIGSDRLPLAIDWTTGTITGTWTIDTAPGAPSGTPPLSFAVTGRINLGSSRLSGTITGAGFDGTFSGAVFGPRAKEIAYAFAVSNAGNGVIAGTAGASR